MVLCREKSVLNLTIFFTIAKKRFKKYMKRNKPRINPVYHAGIENKYFFLSRHFAVKVKYPWQ